MKIKIYQSKNEINNKKQLKSKNKIISKWTWKSNQNRNDNKYLPK